LRLQKNISYFIVFAEILSAVSFSSQQHQLNKKEHCIL